MEASCHAVLWDTATNVTGLIGAICILVVTWRSDRFGYLKARLESTRLVFKDESK